MYKKMKMKYAIPEAKENNNVLRGGIITG